MVTLTNPSYYEAPRYAEYCGLSTDNKATIQAYNADQFYEMDTGKYYRYNETSLEWIEQPAQEIDIDTNIPPISNETAGHFLSNDGTVTHWQEFAAADFIVHLTNNQDGSYMADKTFVEIKTAYESKENIAVEVDNARLPLMNAQFANDNEAGFTFGYTQVTTDGQLVSTRSIHYLHIPNQDDEWTDTDQVGEYLRVSGGTLDGNLSMANNNITDVQELKVDGQFPLYLGNVIHSAGTQGVRLTCTTNGEAAVVTPDSQANYKPINVGNPTANEHAVTLGYLTEGLRDDTATKNHVSLARNSAQTITLQNGVYLLTACNTIHRGLTVVYMCGDTTTISNLTGMAGWEVTKGAVTNSLYINNKSDVQGLDVYIIALGAASAI